MPVATMTDPAILMPAVGQAFRKLDPRLMVRNPVMFAVEVVATLTTLLFLRDLATGAGGYGFSFQINLWLDLPRFSGEALVHLAACFSN